MQLKYLFLLIVGSIFSQTISDINGYEWSSWTFSQKSGYVNGFYGGLEGYERVVMQSETEMKDRDQYWHPPMIILLIKEKSGEYSSFLKNITIEELIKRIDGFYIEPDNKGIKLYNALRIINLRSDGQSERGDLLLLKFQKEYLKGN